MNYVGNQPKTGQLGDGADSGADVRRNVLLRAANGSSFQKTHRLKDFLLYVGTRALDGRQAEITEQQIGVHVFERGENFSPSEDNIVRATARTLRVKLKEHFEGEGRDEPWRIEIPKGSYVPVFTPSEVVAAPVRDAPARGWVWAVGLLLVVLAATAAWLGWRVQALEAPRSIFTVLMGRTPALSVVCSDSLHGQYQSLQGRLTPLEDYASGKMFGGEPPSGTNERVAALWPMISAQLLSNQEDLRIAMRLVHSLGQSTRVELRHPRTLRMTDFREGGDFLLMAARRANPWVGLFEANLSFQMVFPSAVGPSEIHNLRPKPGEQGACLTVLNGNRTGKAYARIGLVPGLAGKGRVLLVAGSTGQATDAAGEVLLNPASLEDVERMLGRKLDAETKRLEILVETAAVGGSTRDYRIIAVR